MSTDLGNRIESETDVKALTKQIAMQHEDDPHNPFTLLLGTACRRAASVPDLAETASQMFNTLFEKNPALVNSLLSDIDRSDKNNLIRPLENWLANMSDIERQSVLQTFYAHIPVPLFYQNLALLVKARFFSYILTTNIDTLLERALDEIGLEMESDYEVLSLSQLAELSRQQDSLSDSSHIIKIVKLHRDLGERVTDTPEQIIATQNALDTIMTNKLQGNMVMVGYEYESPFLNHRLASTRGSSLWWVSPESPSHGHNLLIERMRSVTYIHGPNAEFEAFFGKLALHLLRPPVLEETTGPFVDNAKRLDISSSGPVVLSTTTSSRDEKLEIEYLQKQLTHCQHVLYRLKQEMIPGVKNVRIQAQMEYQKQQIIKFGDILRNISRNRDRLIELMDQVIQSTQQSKTDPMTLSYLEYLIYVVKEAYNAGEPNQNVISGSISAIIQVANRLGSEAVKPELVREMRSFAHLATL